MAWVILVILLILIGTGLFTVKQQTIAIVERFGRFTKASRAGLNFKIPIKIKMIYWRESGVIPSVIAKVA